MQSFTVLCIDDEILGLQIRKAVLERAGYTVLTAPNGKNGICIFKSQSVDAVLLDYLMPEMDGGAVAVAMRQIKPEVPILLHSACVDLPADTLKIVDSTVAKGEGPMTLIVRLQQMIEASRAASGSAQ